MIKKLYQIYQKSRIYQIQCMKRAKRHFNWLKRNYKNEYEIIDEVEELISYMEAEGKDDYTKQMYYPFCNEYDYVEDDVFYDEEKRMFYAKGIDTGYKKLYFSPKYKLREQVVENYRMLCYEQDTRSPHRYLPDDFEINNNHVLLDIGAAEGNFSLSVIDTVGKIYLFECDEDWMEALEATFLPYADKVEIINKYVGDVDKEKQITIDSFLKEMDNNHIILKMDIEGAEIGALKGSTKSINDRKIEAALVCAYHNQNDEKEINAFFDKYGYVIESAHGFITRFADLFAKKPYIRRGVLRIKRAER